MINDIRRRIGKSIYNVVLRERILETARVNMQNVLIIHDEIEEIDVEDWNRLRPEDTAPINGFSVGKQKKKAQWLNKPYGRRK
jgi:hypothetical protein